jgi:hypothetical protein
MSHDHHPALRNVTADTENTASSIVAYWTVCTELLPGNALIKSVAVLKERFIINEKYVLSCVDHSGRTF